MVIDSHCRPSIFYIAGVLLGILLIVCDIPQLGKMLGWLTVIFVPIVMFLNKVLSVATFSNGEKDC